MIFYPSDIEMWQGIFDFNPSITLTPKLKTDYIHFYDRAELFDYLKRHGVRLDDAANPLLIETAPFDTVIRRHTFSSELYAIKQKNGVIGWVGESY